MLVFFRLPCQFERVCDPRLTALDTGNHVRAADPMSFRQVSLRPAWWMVGMRVVKTYNLQSSFSRLPLNAHQLLWSDVIPVVGRIGAGVATSDRFGYVARLAIQASEEHTAAFVGVCFFAVVTYGVVFGLGNFQHWFRTRSGVEWDWISSLPDSFRPLSS